MDKPLIPPVKYLVYAAFLVSLFVSCSKEEEAVSSYSTMELEILQLVNQYRITQDLPTLSMHAVLFNQALKHTEYMISQDKLSHDNSNDRFKQISTELGSKAFGENVARGYRTAHEVVNAWLGSEGHKANIEGGFSRTGISAMRNEQGVYYYTQIFTD
jgi:uncharacterized protein YkwD